MDTSRNTIDTNVQKNLKKFIIIIIIITWSKKEQKQFRCFLKEVWEWTVDVFYVGSFRFDLTGTKIKVTGQIETFTSVSSGSI